jgi:hypothetical protein
LKANVLLLEAEPRSALVTDSRFHPEFMAEKRNRPPAVSLRRAASTVCDWLVVHTAHATRWHCRHCRFRLGLLGEVAPVLDAVPTTLAATTDAITSTASHVVSEVAPVLDAVPTTLAATTDAITSTASHVVSEVAPVLDAVPTTSLSAPTPVSNLVANASSESTLPAHDLSFLSSDTITIADTPPVPNELFASGHYTDYGVVLNTTTAANDSVPHTLDPAVTDVTTALDAGNHTTVDHSHDLASSLSHTSSHVGIL